jgi:hypothetical protein
MPVIIGGERKRSWQEYVNDVVNDLLDEKTPLHTIYLEVWLLFNGTISEQLERVSAQTPHKYGSYLISRPLWTIRSIVKHFASPGTRLYEEAFDNGMAEWSIDCVGDIVSGAEIDGKPKIGMAHLKLLQFYMTARASKFKRPDGERSTAMKKTKPPKK